MTTKIPASVLMVCTGNICRSPTAEAVLRQGLQQAGYADCIVDSCGTEGYHIGDAPDSRSQQHARQRGYELSTLRARQLNKHDFERFELILAMDKGHLATLQRRCPTSLRHKLALFLDRSTLRQSGEVPDPYYGGAAGFEDVLDLIEDGCAAWLAYWQRGGA